MRALRDEARDRLVPTDPIPQLFLRLQRALELENESLKNRSADDAGEHIARKNQALLELQRVISGLSAEELKMRAADKLRPLREAVRINSELLSRQISAVREVSEILRDAIHMSDSDGTYSAYPVTRGRKK
ncbi:MAG: hypothetical protein KJ622_16595 [Alphaproteobacteria bacterium]|nr:hypothetical protein [Alphaproteobacteria bacterium]